MPLVRIDLRKGKDVTYRQEIGRVVYEAMVAVAGVPANARFQVVSEYDANNFLFDAGYLGIDRSDDLVILLRRLHRGAVLFRGVCLRLLSALEGFAARAGDRDELGVPR